MRTLFAFLLATTALLAQNSGVQGQVTDSSGAAAPNASIKLSNIETGVTLDYTTNEQGLYVAPSLNPGRYRLEVSSPGFASQSISEFRLEVGQIGRFNFELKPGALSRPSRSLPSAVLLNADTTEVGQVIDSKRITEMPLNGRNYLQLAQFTTGVIPGGNSTQGSRARDEGAFAAVGMQMAQNNVLLDGNDNSSRTSGGPLGFEAQAVKPPVDAVAEFKVVTNNMSAEYGYRAGAKVLVNTRAGTNDFHGSLYHFLRNDTARRDELLRKPVRRPEARLQAKSVWRHHRRPNHQEPHLLLLQLPGDANSARTELHLHRAQPRHHRARRLLAAARHPTECLRST